MSKRRANPAHRYAQSVGGSNPAKSKPNFWMKKPEMSSGCGKEENGGVLALELSLQKARLEPINGRHSPVRGRHLQDSSVGSPSTHWRGLCAGLPTLSTPVHHLFSLPSVSLEDDCKAAVTDETNPGSQDLAMRPASCPSSLCSSAFELSENASYTEFRKSLTAVKSSLHLSQMTRAQVWDRLGTRSPRGRPSRDAAPRSSDLSHGAQGVVSRLRGQLHGPGPQLRSMPVQDLTSQVPIRKGQSFPAGHGCMKASSPALGATVPSSELRRWLSSGHEPDNPQPHVPPAKCTSRAHGTASVEKAPLQSLMTAVHEVAEVLHVLGKHRPDLNRPLFERLISWSSDVAQNACFVADVDFNVPKVLVDKAHSILSQIQQRPNKNRATSPTGSPRPDSRKLRMTNGARCPTREAPPVGLHWQSPYVPIHVDPFTPSLQVRGLSTRDGAGMQPSTPATPQSPRVSILHGDMSEHEFEIQGVQLMHEQLLSGMEGDVGLKGLICNHAHTYLAPRSPEQIRRQADSRRERIMKAGPTSVPSSPRTPHTGCKGSSRPAGKSQQQKPTRMFGWDQTDQIPVVSAFYEGGVNSPDSLFPPTAGFLNTASPEIWDYVGNS